MALAGGGAGALALGVARWKRGFVARFIAAPGEGVLWRRITPGALDEARRFGCRLYVWASREPPWLAEAALARGLTLNRIEDGFLRSAGLGSNCVAPLSLVVDERGIYFDPARESGLERRLNDGDFPSPELRAAARRLRQRIVAAGISKYNLKGEVPPVRPPAGPRHRRTILVPGQVENDASLRRGARGIARNLDLLAEVRRAAPDATILYKPHPDIEAGNRRGAVSARRVLRHADRILTGCDAATALALADEVHTMTSLMGFEALLRGLPVTCYGLPFYAGLGLTTDRVAWPRPRRPVDLDALVAAALLAYPAYRDPVRGDAVTAFDILAILERRRRGAAREPASRALRWLRLSATFGGGLVR